jgi:hypothetical protein
MNKLKISVYFSMLFFAQTVLADLNVNTSINTSNGDSITAWENYVGPGNNIFVSRQVNGTWNAAVGIADPATYPSLARTAINTANQIVVIWMGYDTVTFSQSLFGSFYDGASWTAEQVISDPSIEYVIGDQHQVKVAADGTVVVTWIGYLYSGGTNEARGIYVPTGTFGTWTAPITIP